MGLQGEDSPVKLFKTMLRDARYQNTLQSEPLDAVLVLGDYVKHGLASKNGKPTRWSEIKTTIHVATQKI